MLAIFETIESYAAKNREICLFLGYPDGHGTDRYAPEVPMQDSNGKYVMPIMPHVERFFANCVIVESVEYPDIEGTNEIN